MATVQVVRLRDARAPGPLQVPDRRTACGSHMVAAPALPTYPTASITAGSPAEGDGGAVPLGDDDVAHRPAPDPAAGASSVPR